jgi:hypothetical protein
MATARKKERNTQISISKNHRMTKLILRTRQQTNASANSVLNVVCRYTTLGSKKRGSHKKYSYIRRGDDEVNQSENERKGQKER